MYIYLFLLIHQSDALILHRAIASHHVHMDPTLTEGIRQ